MNSEPRPIKIVTPDDNGIEIRTVRTISWQFGIAYVAMIAAVGVLLAGEPPKKEPPAEVTKPRAALKNPRRHDFDRTIKPLLVTYCYGCHNAKENKGKMNLVAFATAEDLPADAERLQGMLEAVGDGFMPPKEAKQHPSDAQRKLLVEWLGERLHRIALAQAGDPGKVVVRRLTNAELNYTLTDLTGIERDWTKDFPRDASGGEGFTNTGQTLQMSASQIEKYLALAQRVTTHALMLPGSGPVFFETPVGTIPDAERARLALGRLDDYCRSNRFAYKDVTPREQITSYAYPDDKKRHREGYKQMTGYKGFSCEVPGATLRFLGSTHRLFYRTEKLNPTPMTYMIHRGAVSTSAREDRELSNSQAKTWSNLWLDLRFTTKFARPAKISLLHRWFSHQAYRLGDNPEFETRMKRWKVGNGKSPNGYRRHSLDPVVDLSFTVFTLADHVGDIRKFTPEELLVFGNIQRSGDGESRTLMVPNHDAFDVFLQQSLDDEQLERLWQMVCDPQSKLAKRLRRVPSEEIQAEWNSRTEQQRRWKEEVLPRAQDALCHFATHAWRRPLRDLERNAIRTHFAKGVRAGQSSQEAMVLPLVRIFMSPHFLYRMEFGDKAPADSQKNIRALSDYELASRLSNFLWSSIPDDQLWEAAAGGELSDPEKLAAQARRMLKDPRIRRFSREMFGQWLGFYRFREFDRPAASRFPEFDDELREQMINEPLDFCTDLVANDRDIRSLLFADYAFLPRRLAQHYGIPVGPNLKTWAKFSGRRDAQPLTTAPRISLRGTKRRGVLGWGAILTATSHPLRTSPVLRGNWILDELLGMPTPPPPNDVPELPKDEKNDQGMTIAQLLARHRQDKACAVCHDRIDPLGLTLENFDPIGRYRQRDLNGASLETKGTLHNGTLIDGVTGLLDYLQQEKQTRLFRKRFSRKMLGYALGREVLISDTPLLDEITTKLEADKYHFSLIVESVVTSKQFRHLRHEHATPPTAERKIDER